MTAYDRHYLRSFLWEFMKEDISLDFPIDCIYVLEDKVGTDENVAIPFLLEESLCY